MKYTMKLTSDDLFKVASKAVDLISDNEGWYHECLESLLVLVIVKTTLEKGLTKVSEKEVEGIKECIDLVQKLANSAITVLEQRFNKDRETVVADLKVLLAKNQREDKEKAMFARFFYEL